VKFAIVHSAGFTELGNDGRVLQKKIVETILKRGTRVIGPNCMGLYCPEVGINTITSIPSTKEDSGGVAFVGQSGWVTENVLLLGHERGLRFSKVLSIGNQSDLTVEDLLAYLGTDSDTGIIGLYVEGLKRANEFLPLAKEVSRKKPVVVWKAGRTEEGAKATTSHTGSIAGNALAFDAAIRQSGLIAAKNLEEMIDLLVGFSSPVLPRGGKLGLLVEAGGGAVVSADAATVLGFELPILSEELQHSLKSIIESVIPAYGAPKNPVDIVWGPSFARSQFFVQCAQEVLKEVDTLLLIHYGVYDNDYAQGMSKLRDGIKKPILVVPGHHSRSREGMSLLTRNGIPAFTVPERALSTLAGMRQYSNYRQSVV
jgi:acyl-CoA synthetase (NDP forming)